MARWQMLQAWQDLPQPREIPLLQYGQFNLSVSVLTYSSEHTDAALAAISVTASVSWTISFDVPPVLFAIGGSTSVATSFQNTQSYQSVPILD